MQDEIVQSASDRPTEVQHDMCCVESGPNFLLYEQNIFKNSIDTK